MMGNGNNSWNNSQAIKTSRNSRISFFRKFSSSSPYFFFPSPHWFLFKKLTFNKRNWKLAQWGVSAIASHPPLFHLSKRSPRSSHFYPLPTSLVTSLCPFFETLDHQRSTVITAPLSFDLLSSPPHQASCFKQARCLSSKLSTDRSLFASASPSHPIIHDKSFILGSIQQPIVSNYSSSLSFDPLTVDQPPCTVNPRRTIVTSPGCNFRRKGECN